MNNKKELHNFVLPPAPEMADEQSRATSIKKSVHKLRHEMHDATQKSAQCATYDIPLQHRLDNDILEPRDNDVLTGKKFCHHAGNVKLRDMCFSQLEEFIEANENTKQLISQDIVDRINAESGRFLEQRGDAWVELSAEKAVLKVFQRFKRYKTMKKSVTVKGQKKRKRMVLTDDISPEYSNNIIEQLNGGKPGVCLLGLAKFFRAKSSLLRKQAAKLDEMAIGEDITLDGVLSPEDTLYRKNVLHHARKSKELLSAVHEKMDFMEDELPTWDMAKKIDRETTKKRRRLNVLQHAYNIFTEENYNAYAVKCQSRRVTDVGKLVGAGWRALTEAEKQSYIEKAVAGRKREQIQQSAPSEKKYEIQRENS